MYDRIEGGVSSRANAPGDALGTIYDSFMSVDPPPDLKLDINNFLWTAMPESMTLGQAEELAGEIYEVCLRHISHVR